MLLQYTPSDVDDKLIEISFMFIVALYGMAVQSFLPKLLFYFYSTYTLECTPVSFGPGSCLKNELT